MNARELRRINSVNRENRQPCYACGKHKTITQLHHVVSLKECAKWMNLLDVDKIETPMVWLCPNCHSYLHKWVAKANTEGLLETAHENGVDVYHKLCEVSHMGGKVELQLARMADEVFASIKDSV